MNPADLRAQAYQVTSPTTRRRLLTRARTLEVRNQIVTCRNCPLHQGRTKPVPFSGKPNTEIVFVGEAPGYNEDRTGEPFVGRAGELLDRIFISLGINREDMFITNVVCCRPPQNRDPNREEIEACQPNLEAQLEVAGTWTVVPLGRVALSVTTGQPTVNIGAHRGKPFWRDGRVYIPTYHPAYALRNEQAVETITKDIELALRIRRGEVNFPEPDWDRFQPVEGRDINNEMRTVGWVLIYSRRLHTQIIIIKDGTVTPPGSLTGIPVYTIEELTRLGELNNKKALRVADLRRMHLVKTIGGTLII